MANDDPSEADMVCRIETFTKSFSLKITGFSLIRPFKDINMMVGTFDLAGHTWAIRLSPFNRHNYCMRLHLELLTETKTEMGLEVEFSLFDHKSGRFSNAGANAALSDGIVSKQGDSIWIYNFMRTSTFEKSDYLEDDCFTVKCSVKLVKPLWVETRKKRAMWDTREDTDVVFQVGEETFSAHSTVLAARSPVFKAEFSGPMLERKTDCVKNIEDIKPEVFKLMLQFVYTDTIPLNQELSFEMAQHLLVAADRYGLERLKLICSEKLSDNIDVEKTLQLS